MKRFLSISLFCIITVSVFAQSNKSAESILDKFSETATSAPSISIDFKLTTIDEIESYIDTIMGSIIMKGDSYYLNTPDNTIWYNGTTSWSYYNDIDEVTISNLDEDDETFLTHPSLFFTAYKKGYRYQLSNETDSFYTIELFPEGENEYMVEKIAIVINKNDYSLHSLEYIRSDGYILKLQANSYILTKKVSQSDFTFNPSNYRSAEIIDMR